VNRSEEDRSAGEDVAVVSRRLRRWRRPAVAVLALVAVIATAAWLQRRTIARSFVDRELARLGVPARYEIEQLSPWQQRLTNLSIGDPRNPDLTADWIELRTSLYPWRAEVLVVRTGTVRMRGRIVDGALSLGAIDKLMPAPSGKPFALPRLIVDVRDAQLRLDSEMGQVELGLSGKGMLSDGFAGMLRARSTRLRSSGCVVEGIASQMRVRIRKGAPALEGPAQAAQVACGEVHVAQPRIELKASLDAALARWSGQAGVGAAVLEAPAGRLDGLGGSIDFAGDRLRTQGSLSLRSRDLAAQQIKARAATLSGRYALGDATTFQGRLAVEGGALPPASLQRIAGYANSGQGTPVAPLVQQLARALREAGRGFGGSAGVDFGMRGGEGRLHLADVDLAARSGARLRFGQGAGVTLGFRDGGFSLEGQLSLGGGGLPDAMVRLSRRAGSAELRGTGYVRPYAAGDARLELARLDFSMRGMAGSVRTVATLSGPVSGGRVEGLSMPLQAHWDGRGVEVNPGCNPVSFSRVAVSSLVVNGDRLALCPVGPAMLRWKGGVVSGGVRAQKPELEGRIGDSPLRFSADTAQLDLGSSGFAIANAALRLGTETPTRLDIGALTGRYGSGLGGNFEGLGGQIGAVPLLLSEGKGDWAFQDGALSLKGGFTLADAPADTNVKARFEPLVSHDATLSLRDGKITARAGLVAPVPQVPVGSVTLSHDLAGGAGEALLDVPGIAFHTDGLQPNALTSLTYGVIADVDGLVAGSGRFAWNGDGVTSTGRFTATDLDLGAAFGPVQGLTTQLDFTDLLGLRTAPGQQASVRVVNPGVPVRDGQVRYALLDATRVQVEAGRWPFAGGELVLDPTVLDFGEKGERRLTFHVKGVDAALFLKEMAFDNLDATGVFDGTLPMIFDANGGRIEGGELHARSGGHIAYVGEVTRNDVGFWGNMAFQALKSLDYKKLAVRMNGPLAGEMITDISFSGVSQGKGTRSNFLIRRLAKLPFVFNVRISAPFRQLLDSAQSWYDPSRLIERNLPALLEEQNRAEEAAKQTVQPRESAPVP